MTMNALISKFQPISLGEMGGIRLMNRTDTKEAHTPIIRDGSVNKITLTYQYSCHVKTMTTTWILTC